MNIDPIYLKNKEEFERKTNISKLKRQLTSLNEDLLQVMAGVEIPNIEEKKAEFRRIHGDIRELEGKPRERQGS
jgi:hypothetical protein|nr:MAG TPA: hypothetical protein [Caudoviricetes sp.]